MAFKRDRYDRDMHDRPPRRRSASCLLAAEPDSTMVGEEAGTSGVGGVRWYVDPIDGSANFARGLPFWCASVGAVLDGEVVAGAYPQGRSEGMPEVAVLLSRIAAGSVGGRREQTVNCRSVLRWCDKAGKAMNVRDRLSRYFERHPIVAFMCATMMLGGFVLLDYHRLREAAEVMGAAAQRPLTVGVVAGLATALCLEWLAWNWRTLSPPARSFWAAVMITWSVCTLAILVWYHPRHSAFDELTTTLGVGCVAYLATVFAAGMVLLPFNAWMQKLRDRVPMHDVDDLVEVWHVTAADEGHRGPYYIAHCECGWESQFINETTPKAESKTLSAARRHGTRVATTTVERY